MKLHGLIRYFGLSLRLNFRSRQAVVYGYFVPFLFLVAFGSVFRADTPILWHDMGELLTLTILGGTCFGLPTALVAERERGVWKRYRLLPISVGWLVIATVLARAIIVLSAVTIQIGLARAMYGTPWPLHPALVLVALMISIFAFAGLGLLVAGLASDVPAVQALGQCLFLPMVMLGGVGIPLVVLPKWAQVFAAFMPGRYSVDILQNTYSETRGFHGTGFSLCALAVIGAAGALAGARLFRWDLGRASGRLPWRWTSVALCAWVAVGLTAVLSHHTAPVGGASYTSVTDQEINQISYDDLPGDNEIVTRMSAPFSGALSSERLRDFSMQLREWPPGRIEDVGQRTRNLVSVAAVADVSADMLEGQIARTVYDQLVTTTDETDLRRALAWIIVSPDDGTVFTTLPELSLSRHPSERLVRERSVLYAKKFLGRLVGKIHAP